MTPIVADDLIAYNALERPEDDATLTGGGRDPDFRPDFVQLAEYHRIIRPIIEAEIEEPPPPEKMVVPIEFLAPDTPNRIRRYAGMPELPGENGK